MRQRKANRMRGYDYSRDNLYFVTSCVYGMVCRFGNVKNGEMCRNEFGNIAHNQLQWLEERYPYVCMHEFVVMPNHVHAIVEIDRGRVRTGRDPSVHAPNQKIKSLSELMGAYKTTSSKQIHLSGDIEFAWQRSFHDRIIRDEQSYYAIRNYIINNPGNWKDDGSFLFEP